MRRTIATALLLSLQSGILSTQAVAASSVFSSAQVSFEQNLTVEERILAQIRLIAAGYSNAVPTARFGFRTFNALAAFEADNGFATNGLLDRRQLDRLSEAADQKLTLWGFRKITLPTRSVAIWVPLGLGLDMQQNNSGLHYKDRQGRLRLDFVSLPGKNVFDVYNGLISDKRRLNGEINYSVFKQSEQWFVISATMADGSDHYYRYHQDGDHVTGFALEWSNAAGNINAERIAVIMSGSLGSAMSGSLFAEPPALAPSADTSQIPMPAQPTGNTGARGPQATAGLSSDRQAESGELPAYASDGRTNELRPDALPRDLSKALAETRGKDPRFDESNTLDRPAVRSPPNAVPSRFGDEAKVVLNAPLLSPAGSNTDHGLKTVEVTGTGDTPEAARNEASRLAVQQVAGLYVDNRRQVESKISDNTVTDVVDEKILTYTNAYVKSLEIIQTKKQGDSFEVRARVSVAVAPLLKVLQDNAVPTVVVDTDSAVSTADSLAQEKIKAMQLYSDLIGRIADLVTVGVGKPEIDPSLPSSADSSWLSIPVTFKVNDDALKEWRSKFELFASQRATIELPVNRLSLNPQPDNNFRGQCSVPLLDTQFKDVTDEHFSDYVFNIPKTFLNDRMAPGEHGVAACFVSSETPGGVLTECFGRRFVVDQLPRHECEDPNSCLFFRQRTEHVGLNFEMLDPSGITIFTAPVRFANFPRINVASSSSRPQQGKSNFFNYCVEGQSPFYGLGVGKDGYGGGSIAYGDIILFPPAGSHVKAYYNQLVPNEKLARIASIRAKIVQDNDAGDRK